MSREAELYKDKIEVSLDGRQIFYLFFGGAVIVGMVFVLGVMVGRRVEARGHTGPAHTSANVDPLAALDRLEGSAAAPAAAPLTFPTTLAAKGVPEAPPVEQKIEKIAADKKPEAKADKPEAKADKPEPKPEAKADKPEAPVAAPEKKHHKDSKDDDDKEARKIRYTLQLSSFQDKGEAQAFMDNIKAAGFDPTLTEAEVDGKGTFYRVRLGGYHTLEQANDAKAEFEKASKKSAYVMRL